MITKIHDAFYRAAEKHKAIRSFYWGDNRSQGFGNELSPIVYVETPLYFKREGNYISYTVDFKVLFPDLGHDTGKWMPQEDARKAGTEIIMYIMRHRLLPFDISEWDAYTLEYDTDNGLYGVRFSLTIPVPMLENICTNDNNFDPDKVFERVELYPEIDINRGNKYPDIHLE
jgi:hypothetical protein